MASRGSSSVQDAVSSVLDMPPPGAPGAAFADTWPTLSDVLGLMEVVAGDPQLLTGGELLGRRVRWAHVSELDDLEGLLHGGELILTTGIALPDSAIELHRYVAMLCEAEVSALVIELGRRFKEAPRSLMLACERRKLPLIVLRREVSFVRVTEAIASLVLRGRDDVLAASNEANDVFSSLCLRGASAQEVVSALAALTKCPVVFEDPLHRVIAWDRAGHDVGALMGDWSSRSRRSTPRNTGDPADSGGWLTSSVEAEAEYWGRLILIPVGPPRGVQRMLLERASIAMSLGLMIAHSRETLQLQSQRTVLADLINGRYVSRMDLVQRLESLGVPVSRRIFAGVHVERQPSTDGTAETDEARRRESEQVSMMCRDLGVHTLVGNVGSGQIGILVSVADIAEMRAALEKISLALRARYGEGVVRVSVGSFVEDIMKAPRSFSEASHVSKVSRDRAPQLYFELPDMQLRGLLSLLGSDTRVQSFVERTLGPLLLLDERTGSDYVRTLRCFLDDPSNRSQAAKRAHLSRQSFYNRIATIERILGLSLKSGESCASLYVAVAALDVVQCQA